MHEEVELIFALLCHLVSVVLSLFFNALVVSNASYLNVSPSGEHVVGGLTGCAGTPYVPLSRPFIVAWRGAWRVLDTALVGEEGGGGAGRILPSILEEGKDAPTRGGWCYNCRSLRGHRLLSPPSHDAPCRKVEG
jgi:hypothetical protein